MLPVLFFRNICQPFFIDVRFIAKSFISNPTASIHAVNKWTASLSLILHLSRHAESRGVKISLLARFLTDVLEDGIFSSISESSIIVSSNSDVSESTSFKIFAKKNCFY